MKILKSILYTSFVLILCADFNFTQDFKIAPNTPTQWRSNYFNVSIASDTGQGFLVSWINTYYLTNSRIRSHLYACRFSKSGEMLDSEALYVDTSGFWTYFCPSAVFAGGNWIIAFNQGVMFEYVGAVRLTPSGEVLDNPPVSICSSMGLATLEYPFIETNGKEILCVVGAAGSGLYATIIDSALNILVDQFTIIECNDTTSQFPDISKPIITTNGKNFFIALRDGEYKFARSFPHIKLIIISPEGEILSIQKVNVQDIWYKDEFGYPMITTLNNITYVCYFYIYERLNIRALFVRRYSSDGNPIDSGPIKIAESNDFYPVLHPSYSGGRGYLDLVAVDNYLYFFLPNVSSPGMSMFKFNSDLLTLSGPPTLMTSDCQFAYMTPEYQYSSTFIRAAALGDNILTAWIDKREEDTTRVYGNMFNINTPVIKCGDVNCDGEVLVFDAALLLRFILGLDQELICSENGDVDMDGTFTAFDCANIARYSIGLDP
ncbi:dockerin type I repeat-containing protein, partial [Bacteroidota bacterium]